jgi:hypothetical protein
MTEVRDQISASPGKRRAASTISTAMAVDRIRKMTDGIIEDVERAIDLQTALEAGNDTIREIQGGGPALSFYGAYGYEAIRFGLTVSLVLTLAKLFDPAMLFVSRAKKANKEGEAKERKQKRYCFNPASRQTVEATQVPSISGEARPWVDADAGPYGNRP